MTDGVAPVTGHELVRTRAGAWAVRDRFTGEVMHPGVGPLVEAERLYVQQAGLATRLRALEPDQTLVLFDVGMGAASNAIAAWRQSERVPRGVGRLELVSFERDLGALRLALEHPAHFGLEGAAGIAARALLASGYHETTRTRWRLEPGAFATSLARQSRSADIIFWDPFSPRANPESWTVAAFAAVRQLAAARCTLFTYSASTAVRVALLLAGWKVGLGAGIGEKAATTAAAVTLTDLARPLDGRWLERVRRSKAIWPLDAPADLPARISAAEQFTITGS